jgi:hypothetical protein
MSYRISLAALFLATAGGCETFSDMISSKTPAHGWSSEPPPALRSHREPPRDLDPDDAVPIDATERHKPAAMYDFSQPKPTPKPSGTATAP